MIALLSDGHSRTRILADDAVHESPARMLRVDALSSLNAPIECAINAQGSGAQADGSNIRSGALDLSLLRMKILKY